MMRFRLPALMMAVVLFFTSGAFAAETYTKMQRGDSGAQVTRMQQALRELGYSLTVDGKFGSGTEKQVKSFQRDQKLVMDGVAGQKTLERLYELAGAENGAQVSGTLQRGSKGAQVLKLQQDLNRLGYGLKADGDFGAATENAVKAFQLINGFTVNGIADQNMLNKLAEMANNGSAPQSTKAPSATAVPAPQQYQKLQRGSSGQAVRELQQALKKLGYNITVDGSYGAATQQVVKTFQRDQKLSVDGIAGAVTQKRLYALAGGEADAPVAPTLAPTVQATNAPTVQPQNGKSAQVVTGGGYLNLRDETKKKVIGTIPNYSYVTVTEEGSVWCAVVYNGNAGYVMTSFLKLESQHAATAKPTVAPTPETVVVGNTAQVVTGNGGGLNLREAPNSKNIIKSIPNLKYVTVTQYGAEWCAVVYEGRAGYVMTKFLDNFGMDVPAQTPTQAPTFVPTVAPTLAPQGTAAPSYDASVFTRTLKKGYGGNDVRKLQERLQALNYLTASQVDGDFGDSTYDAVKLFQKLNGLTVDGVAGKNTFEKLFAQNAVAYSKEMEGYSDLHIYYESADADLVDDIKRMQTRLMQLGYTTPVTGKFDANTYLAVLNFQLRNNLPVTGVGTTAMQVVLYGDQAKPASAQPTYQLEDGAGYMQEPGADRIKLLHWQNEVKSKLPSGAAMLIYDPVSKLSWTLKSYAPGRHCDSEPATLRDTLIMFRAFGKPSWDIRTVYVQLPDGQWTMATMHNYPHLKGNIAENGFDGHVCVHFLRDMSEAQRNDPNYGVDNQKALRQAWKALTGETVN